MKEFEKFLMDEIPLEHYEYVMGLLTIAKARCEADTLWRQLLND